MNARVPDHYRYNVVYDLIRGSAAMAVFIAHLLPFILRMFLVDEDLSSTYVFPFATISVELFFALSGILLGPILYQKLQTQNIQANVWIFLKRRWYRTLPTYYLGLIAALGIVYLQQRPWPNDLWHYLVFLQGMDDNITEYYAVSWSICIEEYFYIVLPLLVFCLSTLLRRPPSQVFLLTSIIIVLSSVIMRYYQLSHYSNWDLEIRRHTFARLDAIMIGAMVSIYIPKIPRNIFLVCCALLPVYMWLILWAAMDALPAKNGLPSFTVQFVFTSLPWICSLFIVYLARNWSIKPKKAITFFADISYPLYIFHVPIMLLIFHYAEIVTLNTCLLAFYAAIGFSYLFFRYFETPILKRRPRYHAE